MLAPLTALLVTQLTLVKTITGSLQRVASVTAGVLLALLVADVLGLHWWSVGLVIFVSLAIGQILKLGSHRVEVPVSALLVLTLGGTTGVARTRVLETLIGAVVGVIVNAVLAPPVYIRPAGGANTAGWPTTWPRCWKASPPTSARAGRARTPTSGSWRPASSTARSPRPGRRSAGPRTACASTPGAGSSATPPTSCRTPSPLEHSAILVRGLCRSLVGLDTLPEAAAPTRAAGRHRPPAERGRRRRPHLRRARGQHPRASGQPGALQRAWPGPGPAATTWPRRWPPARERGLAGPYLLANVDRLLSEARPEGTTWPGTSAPVTRRAPLRWR